MKANLKISLVDRHKQGPRFPVYKGLRFTLQYIYDYDNQPSPEAISKWDSKLLFLLGYQLDNWDTAS